VGSTGGRYEWSVRVQLKVNAHTHTRTKEYKAESHFCPSSTLKEGSESQW
jgi:hypothetical protein